MPSPSSGNRPPSDQELIASFTERERMFYDWYFRTEEERDKLDMCSMAYTLFLRKYWPNPQDLDDYFEWSRKWFGRHMVRARYRMSDEEIFDGVRGTNFASSQDLAKHCWTMEMSNNPLLVLGSARLRGSITGFAVQPDSTFLWPTFDYPDEPGLMHESLLAINLDVPINLSGLPKTLTRCVDQTFVSHNDRLVLDSTQFHPDQTPTNFVFAQLGELCVFTGDWKAARNDSGDDDDDGAWEPTGFGVVVEVQSNGQPKCLWAIYNCMPPREDLEDEPCDFDINTQRKHRGIEQGDGSIFNDPKMNPCFAMKITNDLQDFGPSKELNFQVVCKREMQIVRAKVWEYGDGRLAVVPERVASKK
ncbi:hypothetical protein CDV31_003895 [Fusarium ambrosium]|uniref:Uncharacterized protein n=1 Tax=Fusarium ambrosium TaxID=131363 RepID=A0A428USB5_9HYPO|nr:hypothetical protein CDV31_003895 [Fusarium ambrosium]